MGTSKPALRSRHADELPRALVDRVHDVPLRQSAEILEPHSEYDDEPDCYAVFFRDPDGFKLEVLHVRLSLPGSA
jgi:hypothetical protein